MSVDEQIARAVERDKQHFLALEEKIGHTRAAIFGEFVNIVAIVRLIGSPVGQSINLLFGHLVEEFKLDARELAMWVEQAIELRTLQIPGPADEVRMMSMVVNDGPTTKQ